MPKKVEWTRRYGIEMSAKPVRPGVWRRKEGGFFVRGQATDPRTNKSTDVRKVLLGSDPLEAERWLRDELHKIRTGQAATPEKTRFGDYAVSLLQRKLDSGDIRSAKTKGQWASVLERHLIPEFGLMPLDALRRSDIMDWRNRVAKRVHGGELSPHTFNDWLSILKVIVTAYVSEHEMERNPALMIPKFDTRTKPTYTDEEPNSLTAPELRDFLAAMRRMFPQHFAMVALGFATGLRPSSLRPIRRHGKHADVLWDDGVLLVRRSQTRGTEVMDCTKTGGRQRLSLPSDLVDILRWHSDSLDGKMAESELLFPSIDGKFRAPSVLDNPFRIVAKEIGLTKKITPRGMRRSFQDLCRAAEVKDLVTRAVSGHATEEMQIHYSTVTGDEMRASLTRVVSLAGFREAHQVGSLVGSPEPRVKVAG
jgi:integrase